jgi:hypothetical protein
MIVLRRAALIAVLVGVVGSVGLMLRAGQRTPRFLLVIMVLWVLAPFVALVLADLLSKHWTILAQAPTPATLYSLMLLITLGSLAVYVDDALRPRKAQAAFVIVVVPIASWLLMSIAIPIAALRSRSQSRRRDGA